MNDVYGIKLRNLLVKLFKRGQYVFYTSILEKTVYFVIFVFLARKFSASEYGSFVSIFVLGNILISLFEFGFSNYFQRTAASDINKLYEEFNSAFTFRLITYLLIVFISFIYYSTDSLDTALTLIIITALFVFNVNWLLIKIYYGVNQYHSVFVKFLVSRCILIICSIILLYVNVSLTFFSLSFLISAVSEFVLLTIQPTHQRIFNFRLTLKVGILKKIFASSVPMGLSMFFVMVYDRADVLLIQKILNSEAVGFYTVAYSIYKIPQIFTGIILTPLFSDLSNEFEVNKKINFSRIKEIGILFILFSALSVVLIFILSEVMVNLIYGDKYYAAASLLKLLIFSLPFLFLNNLTGVTLNSIRREKFVFNSTAIGSLFNLIINILLLNIIGLEGAVISTILTELLIFLIQLNYIFKIRTV